MFRPLSLNHGSNLCLITRLKNLRMKVGIGIQARNLLQLTPDVCWNISHSFAIVFQKSPLHIQLNKLTREFGFYYPNLSVPVNTFPMFPYPQPSKLNSLFSLSIFYI